MTDYTPLDSLKQASARARFALMKAVELRDNPLHPINDEQRAAATLHLLTTIKTLLDEHVSVHSPDAELNTYSDGRRVVTEIELEPGGQTWTHLWDADPSHPANQPGTLADDWRLPSGARKRVVISAPGVIDILTLPAEPAE